MKYKSRIWQFGPCIRPEECQALIDFFQSSNDVVDAKIGDLTDQAKTEYRKTKLCWIPERESITLVLFTHGLIANFKAAWGFDIETSEQTQLGEYQVGGHYDWHVDEEFFNKEKGKHRKISVVMQLSDPDSYENGDLILDYTQKIPASRARGSIVAFPSELMHKVTPVTKGVRHSATLWLNGPLMT
jgi:PKHD-type hydroxylase